MLRRTPSWPARMLRPALGDAPQHGVDELGEAMRAAVAPRRLDGEIDDRVRRACRGRRAGRRRRAGSATGGPCRPAAAARGSSRARARARPAGAARSPPPPAPAPGRAPPARHARAAPMLRQHLLQRPLVDEHAGDEVHGKLPCREPGVAGPDARFLLPSSHAQCSPSPGAEADPVRVCFCSKDGCTATRRSSVGILLTPHPTRATLPALGHRISVRPRKTSGSK